MGTRSTTKIYEDGKIILSLYKQYDGYVDGWGKDLKDFIKKGTFVNGLSMDKKGLFFNGIGDFALLLVKEFKEESGGLYATTETDNQEFNYIIELIHNKEDYNKAILTIKCLEDSSFNETFNLDMN